MLFWIVTAGLTLMVMVPLGTALLRAPRDARPAAAYDLDVYRDQLREVDKDVARGVLSQTDAERVRTEVSRRILAADAALAEGTGSSATSGGLWGAGVLGLALVAVTYVTYSALGAPGYGDLALADRIALTETLRAERPSQADAESSLPPQPSLPDVSPDETALIQQLRDAVAARPGDPEGLRLLAHFEARLGNFAAAHAAQAALLDVSGAEATVEALADYADLLILAAGGYVSPEAEAVLNQVLARDASNGTARYYMGLMMTQTGRPDVALRVWDGLLREGPSDAPWIEAILAQIETTALRAGAQYQVPAIGSGRPTGRGPTQDDIDAAQEMSPAERMEMIQGMVAGLGARLASEGGPVEDWAQLISALGVLGQMDDAAAILAEARASFAGDAVAADVLGRVADRVGLE